jgi:hypothetical protein
LPFGGVGGNPGRAPVRGDGSDFFVNMILPSTHTQVA